MTENEYGIMTNKEAIAILQSIKPVPYRGDCKSTTHLLVTAALDMGIKALKGMEMTEEQIKYKPKFEIGDKVKVHNPASRYDGKTGVVERIIYKVRFEDDSDNAFVQESLTKEEPRSLRSRSWGSG